MKTPEDIATKLPDVKSLQNDQAKLMDMLAEQKNLVIKWRWTDLQKCWMQMQEQ